MALPYTNFLSLIFDHFNLITDFEEVEYFGPQSFSNNVQTSLGIFKVESKYELYSNLSVTTIEELQKLHGKKIGRLEPPSKESYTTHSCLESLDSEVCEIKVSLLELHDKVSKLTFMLYTFMKDMKGMVVEEVTVKEDVEQEPGEKEKKASKEGEAAQEGKETEKEEVNQEEIVATPVKPTSPSQPVKATPVTTSSDKPKASNKMKTWSKM